jgi:maltodextrin utilization protein YvdJ
MNIFKGFIKSFYDFKSYAVFKKQSGGKSFLYSLLLAIVFSIVAFGPITYKVNSTMKDLSSEYSEKVPNFQIKGGQLQIPDNKGAEIVRDKSTFVLDNTSDVNVLSDKYKNAVIFGRDSLVLRTDGTTALNQKYSLLNLEVGKADIGNFLNMHATLAALLFVFSTITFMIGFYIRALLVALLGTIFKGETTFGQRYKLSLYATTPSVVLSAIFSVAGLNFRGTTILPFVIGLVYLYLGIQGINKAELEELADEL